MKRKLIGITTFVLIQTLAWNMEAFGKPNVILILADDVGCEPLGCYGGESFKTPNLDKLAMSGMKF